MSNANSFSNSRFAGIKNLTEKKILKMEQIIYSMNLSVGDYKWSANVNDFEGWLKCDGRSLLKSDYPDLYTVISGSFGSNSTHFNLPDMNGRVLGQIGKTNNVSDNTHVLGHSVGIENVTLSEAQIPSHSHDGTTETSVTGISSSGTTASNTTGISLSTVGGHNHTYQDAYFAENTGVNNGIYGTTAGTDSDNQFIWRNSSGGNSTTPQDLNTSTAGSHTHSVTDTGHTHSFTANITDPSHSHSFTTETTGGGQSHSILQPTLFGGNLFIYANKN